MHNFVEQLDKNTFGFSWFVYKIHSVIDKCQVFQVEFPYLDSILLKPKVPFAYARVYEFFCA